MAQGITAYDGTTTDVGFGPGVRFKLDAQTGAVEIGNGEIITTDSNGVERFVINPGAAGGDVAAAYDASGNLLWDTLGMAGVATVLASSSWGYTSFTIGTTWATVPATQTTSFTLSRTGNLLIIMGGSQGTLTSGSAWTQCRVVVLSGSTVVYDSPVAVQPCFATGYVAGLAAGTYTAAVQIEQQTSGGGYLGSPDGTTGGTLVAIQLGG